MRTLILGASGFVGSALVRACGERGIYVRAASRHPHPRDEQSKADWFVADLERPETLTPALKGIDCVYYLVHSMARRTGDFRAVERACATALVHAATEARCERIIYLGGVAPQGTVSEHLASRLEVGEILRAGPVPTLELRASMIIGNGSASWQVLRDLAVRLPVMLLPRWLESRTRPIGLPDVITALLDARVVPLARSAWFDLPGPDTLTMREMIEMVAALGSRRIPSIRVPFLTPRLSALWLKLVTRADYRVARELVLGLGHDLLPRDADYWELTGNPPMLSFREAASLALASEPRASPAARTFERFVRRVTTSEQPHRVDHG